MTARILVAGIGNIFFGDDAFGPAVIARLAAKQTADVRVEDFGIRGMHLAYELCKPYEAAVIVDAVGRGGAPGTLYVIDPSEPIEATAPDAHRMDLGSVFGFLRLLDAQSPPLTIVGCEPQSLDEGADLSPTMQRAVDAAIPVVNRVIAQLLARSKEQQCTEV